MKRKRESSLPPCRSSLSFRRAATQLLPLLALASSAIHNVAAAAAPDSALQVPLLIPQPVDTPPAQVQRESFHLRHVYHHGTSRHPGMLRKLDIPSSSSVCLADPDYLGAPCLLAASRGFDVSSHPLDIQRLQIRSPASMESLMAAGRARGVPLELPASAWTVDRIRGPNVTDMATVLSLARMAADAYVLDPHTGDWEELGRGFNDSDAFGWESDGLRGHIFANKDNSTIVIGLKGTTPAVFDGAETTTNDKLNDNLLFSCCCGQGGNILWRQVCDCKTATYTCNSTCVVSKLNQEDMYYSAAKQLYHNVTARYPHSEVWLSGHSLGGAVSSLLGLTYGVPVVTFEAPGEAMAAARLGLPTPPGYHMGSSKPHASTGGFHFGHTGDPVYLGTCSSCSLGGYAMESRCHTGMECRFDTVKDKGFHSYIGNHKISAVIHDVLEVYDEPAACEVISDCTDCLLWKFTKGNSTRTTTTGPSSTSSYIRTRTEMCKTPGWWGCLDESTTTSSKETSSTSSTSTCETPGWFGCLDETTATSSTANPTSIITTTTTVTTTSTCHTPGWFGCLDPTTTPSSTTTTTTSKDSTTTTCRTPGWWGCKDPTTTTTTLTKTASTSTTSTSTCKTPGFFWGCYDTTKTKHSKTREPTTTTTTTTTCKTPGFFWGCDDDDDDAAAAGITPFAGNLAPTAIPVPTITAPTPTATPHR